MKQEGLHDDRDKDGKPTVSKNEQSPERVAYEVWRATWIALATEGKPLSYQETAKLALEAIAPTYDTLEPFVRACWDAGAQAAYELGKKHAEEARKEPGWTNRVGGRW